MHAFEQEFPRERQIVARYTDALTARAFARKSSAELGAEIRAAGERTGALLERRMGDYGRRSAEA